MKWFRNRTHYYALVVYPAAILVGTLIAGAIYPFPTTTLVAGFALSALLGLSALSKGLVFDVGIGKDRVVLRKMLGRVHIRQEEVERVELTPELTDVTEEPRWFGKEHMVELGSRCVIVMRNRLRKPIKIPNIPEGVKLRIARALDPQGHPGDPLERA